MIASKYNNIIITYLLSMVAFTLPFSFFFNLNSISIILLLAYTLFLSIKRKKETPKINSIQAIPLLYFFFLVFSLIYSSNFQEGIKQISKNASFFLLPLIFWRLQKYIGDKTKEIVILLFVAGNLLTLLCCFLYAIIVFCTESNPDPLAKGSFYFTQIFDLHPTYFSMYLIISVAFIREYINKSKIGLNHFYKAIFTVLLLLLWGSILHLRSRSGILALVLIEVVFLIKKLVSQYANIRKRNIWVFLGGVLLLSILMIATDIEKNLYRYGQEYLKRDTNNAIDERLNNWKASLEAFSESYLFGYGIGDSSEIRDKYFYINGFDVGIDNKYNSHNQFIETLIIGGIFGLVFFLFMYLKLFFVYVKTNNTTVISFLILLFMVMMTESILVRQHGIVFFMFFYVFFNTLEEER